MSHTLQLCAIMKNEEHNLPRFMASFGPLVDKVIITDTGSTDKSVELARSLGAEVHAFPWIGDFAAARNFSFSHATSDYIFWADLDDELHNPEMFKLWRETVMGLADYHLATYHYTILKNKDGVDYPACSFARERVVKREKQFAWSYFLHEGIKPQSPLGPVRLDYATTWSIWHRRTDADLKRDRGRNLALFEGRQDQLDGRMRFYYAKELFENGFFGLCINNMTQALTLELEPHDRVLAHQYLGYAYMNMAQKQLDFAAGYKDQSLVQNGNRYFGEAIKTAMTGIALDPNRAELYTIVADSFIKQSIFVAAIPFLEAAKGCTPANMAGSAGALFTFKDQYSYYPLLQLTKCNAAIGNLPLAVKHCRELMEKHPEAEEPKVLWKELEKMSEFNRVSVVAKECDDIVITCPPHTQAFPWDGEIYRKEFMGGSETAAIEMAENFKKLTGRSVKIFQPRANVLISHGVEYLPVDGLYEYLKKNKPWLHIAWRHAAKLTDAFTILWCHDLTTNGAEHYQNYDYFAALTPFHKGYTQARQGIPEHKFFVTRNGLNPEKFITEPIEKDPWQFVFSSSPDRGLDRAMRVLDKVREVYPKVKLRVHYGIEHLHKYGLAAMQESLGNMMKERASWVEYVGKTNQTDLIKSFKQSAYCVQPSDWIETSMVSAMERLCCGTYQIIRKVGGCVDTLRWASENNMASVVDSDCITESQYQVYIDETLAAIKEERYKNVIKDPADYAWEKVAKEWLDFVSSRKQGNLKTA